MDQEAKEIILSKHWNLTKGGRGGFRTVFGGGGELSENVDIPGGQGCPPEN